MKALPSCLRSPVCCRLGLRADNTAIHEKGPQLCVAFASSENFCSIYNTAQCVFAKILEKILLIFCYREHAGNAKLSKNYFFNLQKQRIDTTRKFG